MTYKITIYNMLWSNACIAIKRKHRLLLVQNSVKKQFILSRVYIVKHVPQLSQKVEDP